MLEGFAGLIGLGLRLGLGFRVLYKGIYTAPYRRFRRLKLGFGVSGTKPSSFGSRVLNALEGFVGLIGLGLGFRVFFVERDP